VSTSIEKVDSGSCDTAMKSFSSIAS